jgi:hypothetical protein
LRGCLDVNVGLDAGAEDSGPKFDRRLAIKSSSSLTDYTHSEGQRSVKEQSRGACITYSGRFSWSRVAFRRLLEELVEQLGMTRWRPIDLFVFLLLFVGFRFALSFTYNEYSDQNQNQCVLFSIRASRFTSIHVFTVFVF